MFLSFGLVRSGKVGTVRSGIRDIPWTVLGLSSDGSLSCIERTSDIFSGCLLKRLSER
jgi:hypothetical protein